MDEGQRTKADSGAVAREADLEPTYTDKAGNVYKKRILTGDRTTGKLHLGHYVGSLRNRVKYQSIYDTFILMADIQALTTHWDKPEILKQSVMDVALDYMAVGMDPWRGEEIDGPDIGMKPKFVVQSHVPAIAELTVLYGLVTPMGLLMQNPTTKAEAEQYEFEFEATEVIASAKDEEELKLNIARIAVDRSWRGLEILERSFPELKPLTGSVLFYALKNLDEDIGVSLKAELEKVGFSGSLLDIIPEQLADLLSECPALAKEFRNEIVALKRQRGMTSMSYGFLGYPVSQAADITFVNAHLVPVGEDQVPHIELTREIVRRMNKQYGGRQRILTVPQALIGGSTIKGLDGNAKMSKSLGNAVYLSDSDEDIWSKVKKAVTDPQRIRKDDPGRPEICNVFSYHQQFNAVTEPAIKDAALSVPTEEETAELCRSAGIGCVECKKNLMAKLSAMLNPMRERRSAWEKRPDELIDILKAGTRRGNEEGNATVERVKSAMHVDYWK